MSPRTRLFVALVSTGLIGYIAIGSVLGRVRGDTTYGQLAIFNEVVRMVLDSYVEPVNLDRAMVGARLGLGDALDGDSAYLGADEFRVHQASSRDADAEIGVVLTRRFAFLMVVGVRAGSPAEKAGLRPGDVLKTIDGKHTRPLAPSIGERLLRGAPGSVVKLAVLRAGSDPLDLEVVRERLAPAPPVSRMVADGRGYLKITEFSARAADDVRAELESLRRGGARSLVLDLRGAAFGPPADAVRVAELFLKGGVVARLAGRKSAEQVFTADATRAAWDLPLAVLVGTGTSGPGEVVAAALLDADRATLVGERTFGRAAVQKAVPLFDGGLIVTVAKYVTPKGAPIHGRGIEPGVRVETPEEEDVEAGVSSADPALDKAIELLAGQDRKAA